MAHHAASVHSEVPSEERPATSTGTVLDRVFVVVSIASIAFLSFIAGAFAILHEVLPYRYLNDAYRTGLAMVALTTDFASPYDTDLWRPARTEKRGVTAYDPERAYDGFTLYTSSHAQKAFLIGMDGEVMHTWHLPIGAVWPTLSDARKPRPNEYIFWDKVYLYPNGDLIAAYIGLGDTPWGYGLVKMNRTSEVIWSYENFVHHDIEVADDGRIYTLTNEIRGGWIEDFKHLQPPRIDDFVVVLSPDGEEIKRVSVLDALLRSSYRRMLRPIAWDIEADYLHTNSIDVIGRELSERLPFASEGQVLLSFRDIDAIAVLDLDKEEIVWALQGSWHRQHDPDILPNGHILLFDNFGHYGSGGMSRVIEFDPVTLAVVWSYTGDDEHLFQSDIRSGQERLPNGNTLITESDGGRIFEVTAAGEIAWEYVNPVRTGASGELIPVVSQGKRIEPAWLDPDLLGELTARSAPEQPSSRAAEQPAGTASGLTAQGRRFPARGRPLVAAPRASRSPMRDGCCVSGRVRGHTVETG